MVKIDELIRDYYAGTITQDDMDFLCRTFLNNEHVRSSYPDESSVLVTIALARLARRRQKKRSVRRLKVAVCLAIMLFLGGTMYVYATNIHRTYCSDPLFSDADVEQWYDKTIETAL